MAEEWIGQHAEWRARGVNYTFAIELRGSGELVGCINLDVSLRHRRGELGYWVGPDHWGRGYATEACREVIRFGFEERATSTATPPPGA